MSAGACVLPSVAHDHAQRDQVEDGRAHEPVVDDDVCPPDAPERPEGQQVGAAWARPPQVDLALAFRAPRGSTVRARRRAQVAASPNNIDSARLLASAYFFFLRS